MSMEVLRLSNSEMNDFRRCKRRWWLRWMRELAPREVQFGTPSSLGTLVHSGLEALYSIPSQDPVAEVTRIVEADIEKWPVREDDLRKDLEWATSMLEAYLQWIAEEGKDADLELISGGEASRMTPLGAGTRRADGSEVSVLVMAKLDAHVRKISDSSVWALEHKTVQSLDQPLATLKLNTQALTQHLVEFLSLKADPEADPSHRASGTLWNMLKKSKRTARAKPPFYHREEVRHNEHELRSHWYHVASIAQGIVTLTEQLSATPSAHHFHAPPSPNMNCSWDCPFFRVCNLLDDGGDIEGALSDLYVRVDPLERYAVSENDDRG